MVKRMLEHHTDIESLERFEPLRLIPYVHFGCIALMK
jgi:hypothetical protein